MTQNNFRSSRPFYVLRLPNYSNKNWDTTTPTATTTHQFAICRSEVVPEAVAAPARIHSEVEAEEAAALGVVVVRNSAQVIAQLKTAADFYQALAVVSLGIWVLQRQSWSWDLSFMLARAKWFANLRTRKFHTSTHPSTSRIR